MKRINSQPFFLKKKIKSINFLFKKKNVRKHCRIFLKKKQFFKELRETLSNIL